MGEIKSTLELAMERTRNLVPTREEREEMARREDQTQALAAVRRLLDGELTPAALSAQITRYEAKRPGFPWRTAVCREAARALVPGQNEGPVLEALRALGFPAAGALEEAVRRNMDRAAERAREADKRVRGVLASHGIRGSAVVPSLEADPAWQEAQARLRSEFAADRDRLLA